MFKAKAIKYVASKLPTDNESLYDAVATDSTVEQRVREETEEVKELDLNSLLADGVDKETGEVKGD
jgi:hypothetical protein